MTLLAVGLAVGILGTLLVRTLMRFEREGMARAFDELAVLSARTERLERRVETVEAIVTGDETRGPDETADAFTDLSAGSERRSARTT